MGRRVRQIAKGPLAGIPIGLITIDHLGLVGGDRQLSTYGRVSAQSRDIKELAKRHGVAVLLAIQVSREAGGDGRESSGSGLRAIPASPKRRVTTWSGFGGSIEA